MMDAWNRPKPGPGFWQNLWGSRRLIVAALVVGTLLWFILINSQPVTVSFPFGLGQPTSTVGMVVLLSAAAGSVATALVMMFVWTLRRYRRTPKAKDEPLPELPEDRPPPDYASQTGEGFTGAHWTAR